jgi:lipopolysaccharide transport protein LptA
MTPDAKALPVGYRKGTRLFCARTLVVVMVQSSLGLSNQALGDFADEIPLAPSRSSNPSPSPARPPVPPEGGPGAASVDGPSNASPSAGSQELAQPPAPASAPTPTAAPQGILSDDLTQHNSQAPIDFTGLLMKGHRNIGRVDLEGEVVITQADARMLADKATLFSEPGSQRTNKALAKGNVRFTKQPTAAAPPLRAEAEEMEYFVPERRILMTGKPKVWRGKELIQGREILLDLDTGEVTIKEARGVVEPGKATPQQK